MSSEKRLDRMDDILTRKQLSLQMMLHDVHDSQNLSAIIRTSDAVGILDIFYSSRGNKTLRMHKTITQGAHQWTRRHRVAETATLHFLKKKKEEGFQVVVTHLSEASKSFREVDYTKPTLIVMGNEKEGVSDEIIAEATDVVIIPMLGMVQSLNVSVATALILYEAQRQRENAKLYASPQIPFQEREEIKEEWIHRDTIARRSKGKVALKFKDDLLEF
jgi:tRNA (guanosine-2'-O-)-methyltransferase